MNETNRDSFEVNSSEGQLNPKSTTGRLAKLNITTTKAITFVVIVICCLLLWILNKDRAGEHLKHSASNSPQQPMEIQKVTITTQPYGISVPLGMDIGFLPDDKAVKWEVRINRKKVYHRPPLNSPEFDEMSYGRGVRYVEVWLTPSQQKQECKLSYYFKPIS